MNLWERYVELIEEKDKKWIQKAIEKPGSLHKALGVPQSEKIPVEKLSVKPGDSPKMKTRKILAKTLKKLHHRHESLDLDILDSLIDEAFDLSIINKK